tara:strand:- start:14338 stop:17943 length:3606 start_codon:yes stop_codon:yes gene_type:complete
MPQSKLDSFFGNDDTLSSLDRRLSSLDTFSDSIASPSNTGGSRSDMFFGGSDLQTPEVKKQRVESSELWDYIPDVVKKGYNESITGLAQQLATGEAPFDLEDYNPSVLGDIGSAVIGFFMPADVALFAVGGGIGGQAAKKAGKLALKQMMRAGVKKEFAEKTLQKGMTTMAGKAGVSAGSSAVALGSYSGMADAMVQEIEDNDVDWGRVIKSAAKGSVLGATVGAIGGRAAAKGTSESVKVAQEIASFGILEPSLDLRIPTPQDFLHAGGMILGIRGANMAIKGGKRIIKGEPLIQSEQKYKEASPEFLQETSEAVLSDRIKARKESEVWKSEREGFGETKIVGVRQTDKGFNVFQLKDAQSNKTLELPKNEFFKEFDAYKDPLAPEALRSKRLGEVAGLQKKLTAEEYELPKNILSEKKYQITGKENISSSDMSPRELFKYRKSLRYEKELIDIKKELKPNLVEFEPGKTLVERLFPANMVQPFLAAETRLKSREGQALGRRMIPEADAKRAEIVGTFVEEGVRNSGLKNYKNPSEVADALEGKPASREANEIAGKIKITLDKAYKVAKDAGIDVSGYIEGYFPRMMRKDIQQIIFDDLMPFIQKNQKLLDRKISKPEELRSLNSLIQKYSQSGEFNNVTSRAINKLVKEGKLSYKEAMDSLRTEVMGEMYSPFGNLEKARKLELPSDFYERNAKEVLVRYFDKFGKRIATAEVFGKRGEKASVLLNSLRLKNPSEHKVLQELYSNFTGLSSVDPAKAMSPAARKISNDIMSFEYATKIGLGFATIPNLSQFTISTAVEAGYMRTLQGAFRLFNPEVRKKIRQSGATHHNVMDMLLGTDMGVNPLSWKENFKHIIFDKGNRLTHVASVLSSATGFKSINYFNQLLAASTAEVYVQDLHRISKGKSILDTKGRVNWAKRNLTRLGISKKSYDKESLSDSNIENAMYKFAKDSQLQKDILKDPLAFNNPKLRPLFIFKRFGFRQAKYFKDVMGREMSMGNVVAPLRLAVGGMFGAQLIGWAKDALIKAISGKDVVREDKEGFEKLKEAMSRVGAMGFFSDLVDAENKLAALKFLVTPVMISDLEKLYSGTESLLYNIDTWEFNSIALQRSVKGYADIFGAVPKQLAKRAELPGQEKRSIASEKGRLRTKIFELFLEGKPFEARKSIVAWNKSRPSNPFTPYDISNSDMYQYVARKARIKANP